MRLPILTLFAAILAGCTPEETPRIADYRTLGELRVATRQDAIAFRQGDEGSSGFEHDLLLQLGERLEVPVNFIVYPDLPQMLRAVIDGRAHLAAAGLARNERLPLKWSAALRDVDYVLVGRGDRPAVHDEAGLAGRMVSVRRGSLPQEKIERLRKRVPALSLHVPLADSDQTLLEQAANGKLDLVATDRLHYAFAKRLYPQLAVAWDLPLKSQIAWALPLDEHDPLDEAVDAFLAEAIDSGHLARVADRYFGHVRRLRTSDINGFLARARERLPDYRPHFQEAQARTGIDWRMLAALSYQESQWNPLATSRTGVRGMMMLTVETADRLGVKDRLDARDSILGGARYLAMLRDELPDEIAEPDRTWMAIAAYNLGMGHLRGARAIARTMERDNTSWWAMKAVLPLLSRPEYAARLKAGAARGGEAVIMTENIRNYYDILTRIEPPHVPPLQPRGIRLTRSD
ncbi:membrane-bound lytic murein transglycosylase MltF [Pseudothauera rhizosphaerae]|uniref:Membrane-bound lytic murein transglycosylase MltF n=1 Tax=Pseudothauera rhizosphaerae TaxID=2565932 RepID=A0A4S4AYF1_9RHOO|nr:membrane-bound lytic murein transglycosylase MltF [Pseudothauera rhizosphaerae]THF64358.1 membrane-bound lytic murein transglycosylase MltF [Pseudothauera rhizosphaerae]